MFIICVLAITTHGKLRIVSGGLGKTYTSQGHMLDLARPKIKKSQKGPKSQAPNPLLRETCPGRPEEASAGVLYIQSMQEKCARVLIPTEDGLFGAGDGGLGFGAEMGKAIAVMGEAHKFGRVYMKYPETNNTNCMYDCKNNTKRDCITGTPYIDTSSLFLPLSSCPAPPIEEIMDATTLDCQMELGDSSLENKTVLRRSRFWYPSDKHLKKENPDREGFSEKIFGFKVPDHDYAAWAAQYFLRLTPSARTKVEEVLTAALPKEFDPERSISIPMRASPDKCDHIEQGEGKDGGSKKVRTAESQCPSFKRLMELAEDIRKVDRRVQYIIFSSDYKPAIKEAVEFSKTATNWTFIFNPLDQDGRENGGWRSSDPARIVKDALQSITSLHLLFRGKWFVLNGASHWHNLIGLLAEHGGCSVVRKPQVIMLDEEIGKYTLCKFGDDRNSTACRANNPEIMARRFIFGKSTSDVDEIFGKSTSDVGKSISHLPARRSNGTSGSQLSLSKKKKHESVLAPTRKTSK